MSTDFRLASHVRIAADADGAVILDLRIGRYVAVNPMGSAVLRALQAGQALEAVVVEVTARTGVPHERVAADAGRFLDQLRTSGLVEPAVGGALGAAAASPGPSAPSDDATPEAPAGVARVSLVWTIFAYLALVMVSVGLKLFGFGRVHRLLRRLPPRGAAPDVRRARGLARAVDRAAAFYVKDAWCLERSLVTLLLMRLRRWPARLVLGVQRLPFAAHAWVELDGHVVNDDPRVGRYYSVLERC